MRKSFVFYLSWKELIQSQTDEELRRFINNLISWHRDEEIELTTNSESAIWSLIEPALLVNDKKWHSRAGTSRENGKLGGRPPKTKITQKVIQEPVKPVNSEKLNVNSEMEIDNCKEVTENCIIGNNNTEISQAVEWESEASYYNKKIKRIESQLASNYPQYPFLNTMASPSGIKDLSHYVEKAELGLIYSLVKELAESRFNLRGNYN